MKITKDEMQCLLWLVLQGGKAIMSSWREFRAIDSIRGTALRDKGLIDFPASFHIVRITKAGLKALENNHETH